MTTVEITIWHYQDTMCIQCPMVSSKLSNFGTSISVLEFSMLIATYHSGTQYDRAYRIPKSKVVFVWSMLIPLWVDLFLILFTVGLYMAMATLKSKDVNCMAESDLKKSPHEAREHAALLLMQKLYEIELD
jgi:hypothetical protein